MPTVPTVPTVHVLVPDSIDDPARPSGGNVYDRQVCRGLRTAGWEVREHRPAGTWPWPDGAARAAVNRAVSAVPAGAVLLVDGLIASSVPDLVAAAARRVPVVVLAHMALGERPAGHAIGDAHARELGALSAAAAVITTSEWLRGRLLDLYPLPGHRVHVAEPGVDPAAPAPGTPGGGGLICVAAVTAYKGHDVLFAALAAIQDLTWRCVCVGPLDREPEFVARLRSRAEATGIAARVELTGPRPAAALARAYAAADLLVVASRVESYGMVVGEALARGLPVIAPAVGGLPEALGHTAGAGRPGILIPSGDPAALAGALRNWLTDADLRRALRRAAGERRATLRSWSEPSAEIARVLAAVRREPGG